MIPFLSSLCIITFLFPEIVESFAFSIRSRPLLPAQSQCQLGVGVAFKEGVHTSLTNDKVPRYGCNEISFLVSRRSSGRSIRNDLGGTKAFKTTTRLFSSTNADIDIKAKKSKSSRNSDGRGSEADRMVAKAKVQRITLRRYLSAIIKDHPELRDMESLSLSIQMACKTISNLVNRNGINQPNPTPISSFSQQDDEHFDAEPDNNLRMNSMKRLDQLSTNVLRNALRFTGKLRMVKPAVQEEGPAEHQPGVLIASAFDSKYVAYFDPLDGSGNADAGICTGTVFGIFDPNALDDDETFDGVDNVVVGGGDDIGPGPKVEDSLVKAVLQPGKNLRAAGYCLYSSATILVFTLGEGTHGFTLDPKINEFVLTHPNIRIPQRGNVYSCNEANSEGWSDELKKYVRALKTGENETKERYALRYVGSMVGDIHRTLMYGGIFFYPSDSMFHPKGNLQLLYKSAPMSYVVEQAGGTCTDGTRRLLDVKPEKVHERSPCFIGSPEDIEEMKKYIPHDDEN